MIRKKPTKLSGTKHAMGNMVCISIYGPACIINENGWAIYIDLEDGMT
jgi:hypothetical protein